MTLVFEVTLIGMGILAIETQKYTSFECNSHAIP